MALPVAALLLAVLLAPPGAAQALRQLPPQRIAAVVNDDVVSVQDLNERLQLLVVSSGIPDTPEARARLAPQVLRGLIEETLQLQEAERLGITVNDEETDRALASIAERNNMSVEQMRSFLGSSGINFETLLRQIRAQIAWVKVVNREIRPRAQVSVDQLELAVQEARQSQGQPEYLLSEIILPVDSPEQEEAAARDAQRLVQTLREGAGFESLARQVSVAASAEQGGNVGWVRAASVPPELVGTLEAMQPGEISDPIRSPVGYHIFWLRDRRIAPRGEIEVSDDVEVQLTQILFPAAADADEATLAELRTQALALRERLRSCADMIQVADETGAPASGALGWLPVADLPPALAREVLQLPQGEVSPPLRGPAGIHLLMVCDRRGDVQPAQPTTLDREQIARRLENERIERLARRYLRDLRAQAFVEVRL